MLLIPLIPYTRIIVASSLSCGQALRSGTLPYGENMLTLISFGGLGSRLGICLW